MVATALGLHDETVAQVLAEERSASPDSSAVPAIPGGLSLQPGATVVLTGDMGRSREEITEQALATGLRVTTSVSRKTTVVAAADPDSLSGKAKKARDLGVPVVDARQFLRALEAMPKAT